MRRWRIATLVAIALAGAGDAGLDAGGLRKRLRAARVSRRRLEHVVRALVASGLVELHGGEARHRLTPQARQVDLVARTLLGESFGASRPIQQLVVALRLSRLTSTDGWTRTSTLLDSAGRSRRLGRVLPLVLAVAGVISLRRVGFVEARPSPAGSDHEYRLTLPWTALHPGPEARHI